MDAKEQFNKQAKFYSSSKTFSAGESLNILSNILKEKEILISKLPEFNKAIKMSKIALVEVNEDINLWKILESINLN